MEASPENRAACFWQPVIFPGVPLFLPLLCDINKIPHPCHKQVIPDHLIDLNRKVRENLLKKLVKTESGYCVPWLLSSAASTRCFGSCPELPLLRGWLLVCNRIKHLSPFFELLRLLLGLDSSILLTGTSSLLNMSCYSWCLMKCWSLSWKHLPAGFVLWPHAGVRRLC